MPLKDDDDTHPAWLLASNSNQQTLLKGRLIMSLTMRGTLELEGFATSKNIKNNDCTLNTLPIGSKNIR